nr:RNA-binding cell elongation regulator Jag/EloR [uncultured Oribacterium sp.]
MDKFRVSAKTVEEAITKATISLGCTSDRISYNVIVQGSNGLFGIGAKPWIIEAWEKDEAEIAKEKAEVEKPAAVEKAAFEKKEAEGKRESSSVEEKMQSSEKKEEKASEENKTFSHHSSQEKKDEKKEKKFEKKEGFKGFSRGGYDPIPAPLSSTPVKREEKSFEGRSPEKREFTPLSEEEITVVTKAALDFLSSVFQGMEMEVELQTEFRNNSNELYINLVGPDMGILIGKRGQTLDSLQYLCSLVVNKNHGEEYLRVKLDTEDYRKRREQTLRSLAKNIAYKVKKNRKSVHLEPMNPYERRIIHAALQSDSQVSTKSEGEDPFRHVVIFCKNGGKFQKDFRHKGNRMRREDKREDRREEKGEE